MSHERVPASACQLALSDVEISDANGGDAKTAPISLLARSAKPIDHPYWGRIVHDLTGFKTTRNKITIDYNHDEPIGYANKFEVTEEGLRLSGALVPYEAEGAANKVIHMGRNGVPYEASINFGGSGIKLERVAKGESTEVNGYTFAGPGVVVREWPLRGVAITPFGADQWTATEFNQGDEVAVSYVERNEAMANEAFAKVNEFVASEEEPADVEATAVEAEADVDTEEAGAVATEEPTEETPAVESETQLRQAAASQYIGQFGEVDGSVYFAKGLSMAEAMSVHFEKQQKELEEMRLKLSVAEGSVPGPLSSGEFKQAKKKEPAIPSPWA